MLRLNRNDQRYSQYARRALNYARLLAKNHNHATIDSSHVLIGISHEESSIGGTVLHELGLNGERAQERWLQLELPRRDTPGGVTPVSPGLHEAILLAADEARWLGQPYVGTEHLLLGIARLAEPPFVSLLFSLAIDADQIRCDIRRLLRSGVTEISVEQSRRMARLSELSRRVLNGAEQLAQHMDHKQVGLAHLLLALAHERRSVCSRILSAAGLDDHTLEADLLKPRAAIGGSLEDTLDRALEQAEALGSHYTGTEHLLLALSQDPRGARLLQKYNVLPADVQQRVHEHLKH